MSEQPSPHALWKQAEAAHPNDHEARRVHYTALMVQHGHVIEKKPDTCDCGASSRLAHPPVRMPTMLLRRLPMTTDPTLALIMSTLRGDNRTGHKAVLWLRTRNAR